MNFKQNNLVKLLLIARFTNKNAQTSYILFKLS